LLERVLAQLEEEYCQSGKASLFARLKVYLVADAAPDRHSAVAADLGLTAGAVKVAVHRLRRRYAELLRTEVARTLEHTGDVEEEIRALFRALA
jgi:RNA polymerase sigma-70 factor (ECF subfamily)